MDERIERLLLLIFLSELLGWRLQHSVGMSLYAFMCLSAGQSQSKAHSDRKDGYRSIAKNMVRLRDAGVVLRVCC